MWSIGVVVWFVNEKASVSPMGSKTVVVIVAFKLPSVIVDVPTLPAPFRSRSFS